MNSINFNSIDFTKIDQTGGIKPKEVIVEDNNLADGLTKAELQKLDTDKDGVLTEEEFKKAYGEEYNKVWDSYMSAMSSKMTTDKDGNSTVTQVINNGQTIKSVYDKEGTLVSYTTTAKTNGVTEEKSYSVVNDQHKLNSTTTTKADGTKTVTTTNDNGAKVVANYGADKKLINTVTTNPNGSTTTVDKNGNVTQKAKGSNATVTKDKNGKLTNVKIDNKHEASFTYKNGKVSSATINGTKYDNVEYDEKTGKIVVKDKDGKKVFSYSTEKCGEQNLVFYKKGVKERNLELGSDGFPKSIYTYDDKGRGATRTYCDTGRCRVYTRDEKGKVYLSTDYATEADAKAGKKKLTEQTYLDSSKNPYENNNNACWTSITYFDENGNVTGLRTYDYKKNADKTVTVQVNDYTGVEVGKDGKPVTKDGRPVGKDKKKNEVRTQDSYANTLKSVSTDLKKNNATKTTTIEYDEVPPTALKEKSQIKKKTIEENGKTTINTYDFMKLMSEEVVGDYKKDYTYHNNGTKATEKYTPANNENYDYIFTTFRANGTKETETTRKEMEILSNKKDADLNHKVFNEKGGLAKEVNWTYAQRNDGNIYYDRIQTDTYDADGKNITCSKTEQYRDGDDYIHKLYDEYKYEDGSSKKVDYDYIEKPKNSKLGLTYDCLPTRVTEHKDAQDTKGTVTQMSIYQYLMEKTGLYADSRLIDILDNFFIHNSQYSSDTMLSMEELDSLDFRYKESNGIFEYL